MTPMGPVLFFPPFVLDLADERLWKNGRALHIRRKPFAILRHLSRHPQRLVTHAELVEEVWGKVVMSDSLLRTHMRDLRHVLGEDIIETVIGRGYRFVADVEDCDASPAPSAGTTEVAAGQTAPLIVGRESELHALSAALGAAKDKRRGVVLVTGEAGWGKTALVDAFLGAARAGTPMRIARGACIEYHGTVEPYAPILEALGALCRGRGGDRAIEILHQLAPTWLVQMPGLVPAERVPGLRLRAEGATHARTLRELAEALEAMSLEAPLVLVLDDLQWCDPSTGDLLALLAKRREPACLVVVGMVRPSELTQHHPLAHLVDELVAYRQASILPLAPLSADGVAEYLAKRYRGDGFPPDLARALQESTSGNPLFVTVFADDLEARGMLHEAERGWELAADLGAVSAHRPEGIRRLVDAQLDRLSPTEQRILEVAAVAGGVLDVTAVSSALDAPPEEVAAACESLADERRLLRVAHSELPDGTVQPRYAFANVLLQHAAAARTVSSSRRLWLRRMAERLTPVWSDVAAQ
jgi:predicted ATPase